MLVQRHTFSVFLLKNVLMIVIIPILFIFAWSTKVFFMQTMLKTKPFSLHLKQRNLNYMLPQWMPKASKSRKRSLDAVPSRSSNLNLQVIGFEASTFCNNWCRLLIDLLICLQALKTWYLFWLYIRYKTKFGEKVDLMEIYHIMKSHSFPLSSLVINILNKKLQYSAIVTKKCLGT